MRTSRSLFVKIAYCIAIFSFIAGCTSKSQNISNDELAEGFQTPPDSVKPYVYWYWINNNISHEGVVRDLEAMEEVGIGGAFIGNIGLDTETPNNEDISNGDVEIFSDEWWSITKKAFEVASNKGIDIGLFNSPGWSQSGGPWIQADQSMRYLDKDELRLRGPQEYSEKLPGIDGYFEDVALLAFPAPAFDGQTIGKYKPSITTSPSLKKVSNLVDDDTATVTHFSNLSANSKLTIEIETNKPFKARSLKLYPAKIPFQAECELQVYKSEGYETIETFEFDRSNPRPTVGFKPYGPVAISFPVQKSRKYRLILSNISNEGGIAEIGLSSGPSLERYVEKQLAKMHQTPLPLWNEYQWPVQSEPESDTLAIKQSEVLNITDHLSEDGKLNWEVPKGEWVVLRLGMKSTGVTNNPALEKGRGLEVDKINKEPLEAHFNAFVKKVLESLPEKSRSAFKYVVADSYETGPQNWTDGFAEAFMDEFGYDPLPWLPVLTGRVVGSVDQSNRFLWDMRRIVADRVAYQYVAGLRELSQKHDLDLWLENYGHWGFPAEFLQYGGQTNEVSGEFWAEGDLGSIELTAASSAAHIYGKNNVWAESFTAAGQPFARYPGQIKKKGDWSFTQGVNNTLLHVYIMQPYQDRDPGVNAWFGTEFNRKNTWFYQSEMYIDYLRRSMFMLQQGKPVVDVAYFIGEDAPKMTGIQKPELPDGYSFDYINAEVINNRLSAKDGKIVLPDGLAYDLLVLPELETMRPALIKKIKDLVEAGANILGPPPERSPSMEGFPEADNKVEQMASELWGKVDGQSQKIGNYGKGKVMWGMDLQEALNELKVKPDFNVSNEDSVLYTHRTLENTEIYFITNQSENKISISPTFRVRGKQPEFWNPVTGNKRILVNSVENSNGTEVPITLDAYQSGFIVFKNRVSPSQQSPDDDNFPEPETISEIKGPWEVAFDSTRVGPENPVIFDRLIDWKNHEVDKIKYYSGSAVYRTSFDISKIKDKENIYIDLGSVQVMAKVKINDQDVGGVWTAPHRIKVTNVLKEGVNQLEIEVVNTWVNRLIGDSRLPEDERGTWTMVNDYTPESDLESSGLLGPVTLKKIEYP